jgi:MFS family permease
MAEQIDKIIRQTRRYWYSDGFTEITIGGLFALVAAFFFVMFYVPPGSILWVVFAFGLPLLIIGGSLLGKRVVRGLKERVTHPRTGYIAYEDQRDTSWRRWIVPGFGLLLVLVFFAVDFLTDDAQFDSSRISMALSEGLIAGVVFAYMGYRVGIRRFYMLAGLSALLGVGASLAGLGDVLGTAVLFTGLGIALVVSGLVALASYLRQSRMPIGNSHDG